MRVARAASAPGAVRQDAALLLHDRGATAEQAEQHLARWGLQSPERARKTLGFLTDPLWRAYISTYVEGERLLSRWLEARPAGQPVGSRFARLLDEQATPAGLRAELAQGDRSSTTVVTPSAAGAGNDGPPGRPGRPAAGG